MRILFLGGSQFVGKHMVIEAANRGHRVTLFNRGTRPLPIEGSEHIQGDRNQDLDRLRGMTFDAVIDTSGYLPRQVAAAAQTLADSGTYLFISSVSVYAHRDRPFQDEEAPLAELDDPTTEQVTGQTYGGLKVLCERAVAEVFHGNRLIIRPGVVVGPDDPTDRFTYWPVRVSRGGEVLAPEGPEVPMQWIDARDLARWLVTLLERGEVGTFNAISEPERFTMGRLLQASNDVTEAAADVTWADARFLLERGVRPFADLPMWLPGDDANFSTLSTARAQAAGLVIRDVAATVRDTMEWYRAQGEPPLKAGIDEERERELLSQWRERH